MQNKETTVEANENGPKTTPTGRARSNQPGGSDYVQRYMTSENARTVIYVSDVLLAWACGR